MIDWKINSGLCPSSDILPGSCVESMRVVDLPEMYSLTRGPSKLASKASRRGKFLHLKGPS